jgi:hypothetical protein
MTYDGRGGKFDIIAVRGADLAFTVTATSDGSPVDLSAATIAGELYASDGTVADTLTDVVSGAGSNIITLSFTDAEMALLAGASYPWTLWVTRGGDKRPWLAGRVRVVDSSNGVKATDSDAVTLIVDSDVNVSINVLAVGGSGGGVTLEEVRDDLATVLSNGDWINIDVDDDADTITFSLDALSIMGYVQYNADATAARPTGFGSVTWVGYTGVTPSNALENDIIVTIPAPTILPSTVAALVSVPHPTVTGAGDAAVSAQAVGAVVSIPSPTPSASGSASISASTVVLIASIPAPSPSGGSGFAPLTSPTPTHVYWTEDPGWTPPSDGATASSWTDGAGSDDLVSVQPPIYRASTVVLNSKPTLEFDGSNDRMEVTLGSSVSQTYTLVVVASLISTPTNKRLLATGYDAAASGIGWNSDGYWFINAGTTLASTTSVSTSPVILRAKFAGASSFLDVNGVNVLSGNAGTNVIDEFTLGAAGDGTTTRCVNAHVAFVGAYSSSISDSEIDDLVDGLMTHYGIL